MGIFLSGRHDEQIDRLLEFLEGYIWKTERVELGKIHTVYFALKYLALHIRGEKPDWREVLNEVAKECELNKEEFSRNVERLIDELKKDLADKIRRGEVI